MGLIHPRWQQTHTGGGRANQRRRRTYWYKKWSTRIDIRSRYPWELHHLKFGTRTTKEEILVMKGSAEETTFEKTRQDELEGFIRDGSFIPTRISDIKNRRIFGSRFAEELKKAGNHLGKKIRQVAQTTLTKAHISWLQNHPPSRDSPNDLALSIASSMHKLQSYTRDITHDYIQSHSHLWR